MPCERPGARQAFSVIYADPPWAYRVWSKKDAGRTAASQYPTMSIAEIRALPVGGIAAADCALFLWATAPMLPDAFDVIRAWGFTYQTVAFCWAKQNQKSPGWFTGMGHWTRANAEWCLLATKGSPRRAAADVPQLIAAPRRAHSQKPDETRQRIVQLMGNLPRVELFARQATPGWQVWGNEVACDITFNSKGTENGGAAQAVRPHHPTAGGQPPAWVHRPANT